MDAVVVPAIEFITKTLSKLPFLTGARRRDRFRLLIKPIYASYEKIHGFYVDLILQTRSQIQALEHTDSRNQLSLDQLASLNKIKMEFLEKRMKDEHLRDTLRREIQRLLTESPEVEERRFLISVGYYFLGIGGKGPSDDRLDRESRELLERGGNSHWDTPSTKLYRQIRNEHDPHRLIQLLDKSRHRLNQRYVNVRLRYMAVVQAIIAKTMPS